MTTVAGITTEPPDFEIRAGGPISNEFISRGVTTFAKAALLVQQLPYGRNSDKTDFTTIFTDNCGTCSTKHALLKMLAMENNFEELQLVTGIFKMTAANTPPVAATLAQHQLRYIPEAHCYLRYRGRIFDYTTTGSGSAAFAHSLLDEIEINPAQITEYKINYHKKFIEGWLSSNSHLKITPAQAWAIREQCIRDLSAR
jgi:hypothetical protein